MTRPEKFDETVETMPIENLRELVRELDKNRRLAESTYCYAARALKRRRRAEREEAEK